MEEKNKIISIKKFTKGKITKGNYHGDMPIVKITKIEETSKPNDEYVYPPSDTYIPTERYSLK